MSDAMTDIERNTYFGRKERTSKIFDKEKPTQKKRVLMPNVILKRTDFTKEALEKGVFESLKDIASEGACIIDTQNDLETNEEIIIME